MNRLEKLRLLKQRHEKSKPEVIVPRDGKDGVSIKGDPGDPGKDGLSIKGEKGDRGKSIKGEKGDPGQSVKGDVGVTWRSIWKEDVKYVKRDIVFFAGSSWICIQGNTARVGNSPIATNGNNYWELLAQKGEPGVGTQGIQGIPGTGSGGGAILEYDTDPISPQAQDAWVLKSTTAGGGGKLKFLSGLGMPVTTVGVPTIKYQFSYRTLEGTTKRVTLT